MTDRRLPNQLIEEMTVDEMHDTIVELRHDVMTENQYLRSALLERDLLKAGLGQERAHAESMIELAGKAQREATYERERANHAEDALDNLLCMLEQHRATVNVMLDIIPDAVSEWADVRLAFTMWRALLTFQHSQVTQRFGSTDISENDNDDSASDILF